MSSSRPSTFADFIAFLVVTIPLVWLFAVVGFGGLADQRRMAREVREAAAGISVGTSASARTSSTRRVLPPPPAKPLAIRIHEGQQAYNVNCVSCHQPGGTGKIGLAPDIHNPDFLALASDAFMRKTIVEGRPGTAMAPWAHLTEDQVTGIIAYLRSRPGSAGASIRLDSKKQYHGDATAGEPLFAAFCASCHGPRGEGYIAGGVGPAIGLEGFLSAASDDYIFHTLRIGRRGTPMRSFMGPSGLADLSEEEIGHLIAFMRSPKKAPIEATASPGSSVPDAVHGREQYQINCAACHQPEGTGKAGFAPSIRNRDFLALASDAFILQTVREGRPGTSMVGRPDLSEAILTDIVAYLRSVEVLNPVTVEIDLDRRFHGDAGAGEEKFNTYCATCHGPKGIGYGAGGPGPAIGLPGFLAAASDDYIYQTLRLGREGTAMRPFLGVGGVANLSDQDASDIIQYLRTLHP